MAMVNGKIVGTKAKEKIKKALKRSKPLKETVEAREQEETKKPKKNAIREGWDKFKETELKQPKQKKSKKTRKETSEPELFRIQIGAHSFLSAELSKDDAGSPVVAVRKWYNTKNDPEIKPAKGGFNMQAKSSEIKLLAAQLKAIAIEIDAKG